MMILQYPSAWLARVHDLLAQLAGKPWALFFLLLTLNSVARPYGSITHDARLYSAQVLNRVEQGSYADDLFFRYGSQDQYSLFSLLAAPLVRWLGLSIAFFLIYLLSKSLLIWGMMRVMRTLIPDRAAAVLTLMYCMAIPLHYGGHHILNVQENFVTPRMLACGLVLLGVDMLLHGRPVLSFVLLVLALAIHPLMAFGGFLLWAGYHAWKYLGGRIFIALTISVALLAAVVLAVEPIGKRVFGEMDDVWRHAIFQASSFNFASAWSNNDWGYLALQLIILGIAIVRYRAIDPEKGRFLIVLLIVTLAGAVGTILAEQLPYALLFQGQPYRALWLLAVLHLGFAFWLVIDWSRDPSPAWRLAGCVPLGYLCSYDVLPTELLVFSFLFPLAVLIMRGLEKEPRRENWLVESIHVSLIVGALIWAGYKFWLLASGWHELDIGNPEYRDILELFLVNLGPIVFLVVACLVLVHLWSERISTAAMAAGWLGLNAFFFLFPQTDWYRQHCTRYRADLQVMHEVLHRDRSPADPLPTVYSNLGCLDYVWIDLHSKSYFDWWQAGNFMFRREMALEGKRRAALVGPFALAHYAPLKHQMTQGRKDAIAELFAIDFERGPLNEEDFARLCAEPGLDYLLLDQRFEGLYSAQSGRLYLYPCQQVRSALTQPLAASRSLPAVRN